MQKTSKRCLNFDCAAGIFYLKVFLFEHVNPFEQRATQIQAHTARLKRKHPPNPIQAVLISIGASIIQVSILKRAGNGGGESLQTVVIGVYGAETVLAYCWSISVLTSSIRRTQMTVMHYTAYD